ncbi:MAG: hypothetical protein JXB25_07140 [Deltaproteobacteria bacterium]|nr:hypothetical protein [Deltaproteobacteria bacterium]
MSTVIGIIIGALLQYLGTKVLEDRRHRRDLRTQAYMDYLKSVCEQAQMAHFKIPKNQEVFTKTADSKARVCLYGSSKVVKAFATFDRLGATMNTPQQRTAFAEMVFLMRKDSGGESGTSLEDLQAVLLGDHGAAA